MENLAKNIDMADVINYEEVRWGVIKMKNKKTVRPNGVLVEVWMM